MLSYEDFEGLMQGGQSRQGTEAVTYILVEDDEGQELFYTEWPFESEEDDFDKVINAYKEYRESQALKINGAWYIDQLPDHIVAELPDGSLTKFRITPFRNITEKDFSPYKGHHPRKMKGNPLPSYLYRHYGLVKNDESLSEVIRARVSPKDQEALEAAAENEDLSVSEFLRKMIREL